MLLARAPEEKVWCVEGGYCCLIAFSSCQPVEQLPFLFLLVENWVLSFQDCSQAVPLTQKLGPAGGSSGRDGHGGCQEDLPCLNGCPLLLSTDLAACVTCAVRRITVYFRLSTPAKFCPQISNPSSSTLLDLSRAGGSHYSAKYHRLCSAGPPS